MANLLSQNEVDTLMQAISSGAVPATEDKANRPRLVVRRDVKLYDFRHPVMFLQADSTAHAADDPRILRPQFRQLAGLVSAHGRRKAKCTGVDQISPWRIRTLAPGPVHHRQHALPSVEGRTLLAIHPAVGIGVLDRVMGGTGAGGSLNRPFTEIEQTIIDELDPA